MSIAPFNASTYLGDRNTANLVGLKSRLDTLTNQLSSGKVGTTYGSLGTGRTTSLSAHAALSALDGYDAVITNATTRVTLASTSATPRSPGRPEVAASLIARTHCPCTTADSDDNRPSSSRTCSRSAGSHPTPTDATAPT